METDGWEEKWGPLVEPEDQEMDKMVADFLREQGVGVQEPPEVEEEPEPADEPGEAQELPEAPGPVPRRATQEEPFRCPHCHQELNPASIPYRILASERGRRNNQMRGGKIWRFHSTNTPFCRCWDCSWERLRKDVEKFKQNVSRHIQMVGDNPWWTRMRREKLLQRREELLAVRPPEIPPPPTLNI